MGLFDWLWRRGAAPVLVQGGYAPSGDSSGGPTPPTTASGVMPARSTDLKACPPGAPSWLQWAWKEIGQHELPENRGPVVERYARLARAGRAGLPWCAMFANAALESVGIPGTRSASSQSFRHSNLFDKLEQPALGAIAVYWRGYRWSGLGHVGFYVGERGTYVWTLGGNEGDEVAIEPMPKTGSAFGLEGYYWPHGIAQQPALGPLLLSADAPRRVVHVT